jgi:hypothetical protein
MRPRVVLVVLVLLVSAAAACVVDGDRPDARRADLAEPFHHALGGLGFGPALDLTEGCFGFDPRLSDSSLGSDEPIPAVAAALPGRTGLLFSYHPPRRGGPTRLSEDGYGPSP